MAADRVPDAPARRGEHLARSGEHPAPRAWPALAWQELPWVAQIPAEMVSRSVRDRHRGPYRAAVVPKIARAVLAVDATTAALAEEAAAQVARFDAEVGPDVAPFAAVLLRSESASSSRIEDLTSGAKAIALAELGMPGVRVSRNAAAVVGNVQAMDAALALAGALDLSAVLAMHRALLRESAPDIAGSWRTQQVWIGGDTYGPHGAAFVPPRHDAVIGLMEDLLVFTRRSDVPVLVHAALAHAQFETIHPFVDGNGRTGRALVHALLRRRELTRTVTVPVSAGLLTDVDGYFDALDAYRAGDVVPIVTALAAGALAAITNARLLVADLREARAHWNDVVRVRRDAATWRLADLLLRQPVVDTPTIARWLHISPANAARPLAPLVEAGVVAEFTGSARNRMWQAPEVLAALDAFAARTGRRVAP